MKRFLIFGILFSVPLFAQKSVDLSGYLESQIMTARIHSEWIPLASNKLRVDLSGGASDHVRFGANFNYLTYHGKISWAISDVLPESVVDEIPSSLQSYYTIPFEDEKVLDNAYIQFKWDRLAITAGKQQISLGTGYAWNPTDIFNTKDLFDPTYEQPGHNAVRIDLTPTDRINLSGLVAPDETVSRSTALFLAKFGVSRFDFSLLAAQKVWRLHDYLQFDPVTFSIKENPEMRTVFGGDLSGQLLGLGVWAEAAWSQMETSQDLSEWLVGCDYTFDSGTYVMAEFYRNTLGKSKSSEYTLNDWLRYLNGEQKALGQDQVFGFIQHPVTDLIQAGLSTIVCLSDGSVALLPTLNWTPFENVEILAYLNGLFGDKTDAFNPALGNGGLLRARVYF